MSRIKNMLIELRNEGHSFEEIQEELETIKNTDPREGWELLNPHCLWQKATQFFPGKEGLLKFNEYQDGLDILNYFDKAGNYIFYVSNFGFDDENYDIIWRKSK